MSAGGLGVDVVSLRRWRLMAERHAARFSTELGVPVDAIGSHEGAAAFGLVECAVKAVPGSTLWETLGQARALGGFPSWRRQEADPEVRGAELLAVTTDDGWRVGCDALVSTGTCAVGRVLAMVVGAHVLVVAARGDAVLAGCMTTEHEGEAARAVLRRLAQMLTPGEMVEAPEGAAPYVGERAASLAHDEGMVVAALEASWTR